MATIYVLTSGEYSDYGIVGVFSDLEKAEACARKLGGPGPGYPMRECRVEEYTPDELVAHEIGPVWYAGIWADDGSVVSRFKADQETGTEFRHPSRAEVQCVSAPIDGNREQIRVISPIGYDHALKIAIEERQRLLRERATGAITG